VSVFTLVQFVAGLALLTAGAELLVRGASRLALALGITPLVVGLTVVAFGTSAPELAVSVSAALGGSGGADLALGNVIGSNIFNVLFILGVSALIAPLPVASQLVRLDVPLLIALSLATFGLAASGLVVARVEGLALFLGAIVYTAFLVVQSRRETRDTAAEFESEFGRRGVRTSIMLDVLWIAGGLVLLVLGSRWLVDSATTFARALGASELIIGLTIIAAGTSLPEVATSVLAAARTSHSAT